MNINYVFIALGVVVFLGLLLAVIILIMVTKKHNITFHFKEPVNDGFIYHKKKAKLVKDNEGQEFYKTLNKINGKKFFPIPESNLSVNIDEKGKKHVFAYLSPNGEICYSIDNNFDLFTRKDYVNKIQPFTSNQRALFVNEFRKGLEDAGFNWKQNLPLIIGAITLVIIMVMSMVVVKDLYSNNKITQEQNLLILEKQAEIFDVYADINSGIQDIKQEISNEETDGVTP